MVIVTNTADFIQKAKKTAKKQILKAEKMTYNRDEKIETDDWIVSNANILAYEKQFKDSKSLNTKEFLKLVYNDAGYIKHMGKTKRGGKATNWKRDDRFICESLHKINNIYDSIGKNKWCKYGKNDTWINEPVVRCQEITKKGSQCRRQVCEHSKTCCTQHFILLTR
jgi:hypothetical protein